MKILALVLLISLIVFSRFPSVSTLPSETVLNAVEILADSSYVSMALTLDVLSDHLTHYFPHSATLFAPADSAFIELGQPSFSLIKYHFSPLSFFHESLRSFPYGTRIPTMFNGKSLVVTTSAPDQKISLNNATVTGSSPIYDDGFLTVFGIEKFFDMDFEVWSPIRSPKPDLRCVASETARSANSFLEDSGRLRGRGYSVMASFLDLQMLGFINRPNLTVFAPLDYVITQFDGNFSEYSSLFLRHVVPCKLSWTDLATLAVGNGTLLKTLTEGFAVQIAKYRDVPAVNGVPVMFPGIYVSDWLIVHGIRNVLELPETATGEGEEGGSSSEFSRNGRLTAPDRTEF